jgi:ribosomal protein S5
MRYRLQYDPEFLTHRYVMDQWSTTKVITSGKLRTASILVIVGDGKGCLGWGIGKHVKEDVAMELAWHKAEVALILRLRWPCLRACVHARVRVLVCLFCACPADGLMCE